MTGHELLRRLLDAGMHFTEMSQTNAEKIVNDFVKAGEVRRKDAAKSVQELVDRGRSSSEQAISSAQAEIAKQLGRFADQLDMLETRIEDLAKSVGVRTGSTKKATAPATKTTAKKATAKKATASAKKTTAKKATAKKATATATKAASPAKKAPAKKAVTGSSGVAKVTTKKATKR